MAIRDNLYAIYDKHKELTPGIVVEEARPVDHPLHNNFEWDDTVAGHKYRLEQARELIRSCEIVYKKPDGKNLTIREFVSVRTTDNYAYQPVRQVAKDPITREIVLRDMEREWRNLKSRYNAFDEFWRLVQEDMPTKS